MKESANSLADARKAVIRTIISISEDILPLMVSHPVPDDNGCEYGLLDRSVLHPGTLSLFDCHNGPDTNPTEFPVSQMKASDLALILHDATLAREAAQRAKRQKLEDDMVEIADAIAEEKGQNVPYVASIDLSEFPWVLELLKEDGERDWKEEDRRELILDTCRFLAANGNKFPTEMEEASFEEFLAYAREHEDDILDEIRKDVESDYEDATGHAFPSLDGTESRYILLENKAAGEEAARLCLLLPQVRGAAYDTRGDTLDVTVKSGTLGKSPRLARNESAFVHLCPDYGYYTVHYETGKGPLTIGGMFDGNDGVAEEITGYPYIHEKEPEWLVPLLDACYKAGRDPSWIRVTEETTPDNRRTGRRP